MSFRLPSPGLRGRGGRFSSSPSPQSTMPTYPLPTSIQHKRICSTLMPNGTLGTPVKLVANFFKFVPRPINFYNYNLKISFNPVDDGKEPENILSPEQRFIRRFSDDIIKSFVKHNAAVFNNAKYIFDGCQNFYSLAKLRIPDDEAVRVSLDIDGRPKVFFVKLRLVAQFNSTSLQDFFENGNVFGDLEHRVTTAYEVFFKFLVADQYQIFQNKFFDLKTAHSVGNSNDICSYVSGFISSVRPTQFGMALNIHLKTAAILSPQLRNMVMVVEAISGRRLDDRQEKGGLRYGEFSEINRWIRHLRVFTSCGQQERTYIVDRMEERTPYEHHFVNKEGQKTTVADYFKQVYNLECRRLPMVRMVSRRGAMLPIEMCQIKGDHFFRHAQLGLNQQADFLKVSTHRPDVYFHKLMGVVNDINVSSRQQLEAFNIELDTRPASFTGRQLPAPQNQPADWRAPFQVVEDDTSEKVVAIFGIQTTVGNAEASDQEIESFGQSLVESANGYRLRGLKVFVGKMVDVNNVQDLKYFFANIMRHLPNISLLIIGIPSKHILGGAKLYRLIKYFCDCKVGCINQCFHLKFIRRPARGYFDNILLKINGKLGGHNNLLHPRELASLAFDHRDTMVVGLDVTHPTGQDFILNISVAAAVGSLDANFGKYSVALRVQTKVRNEIIEQVDDMVGELLAEWSKHNEGRSPKNVVIFRDGVSEGQFSAVEEYELNRIRQKIGPQAKLLHLVVQKRHHTRFVRTDLAREGSKMTLNVGRGTVVDTDIVEVNRKVFYINSHYSPIGTSKPSKYFVLTDDLKLATDELQRFVYLLCYNSTRCREVSSIPIPVKYADLCAYRAKQHIEAYIDLQDSPHHGGDSRRRASSSSAVVDRRAEQDVKLLNSVIQIKSNIKNRLYYC